MNFGNKIKTMRTFLNLTQQELADRCELTKSYISQLENDKTSPSLETLEVILDVLGTNFKDFFSDEEKKPISFGAEDQYEKEFDGYKVTWLVPTSQKLEMEPILLDVLAGSETLADTPHEGQEFGYVLEGSIDIVYGSQVEHVRKGEAFYIDSDKAHYVRNKSKRDAKIIWVSCPPTF